MTTSTDGILAYGFDLGDDFGFDGDDTPDWATEDDDGCIDWAGDAQRALLTATGFTEVYEDGRAGYFAREREAEAALGVAFVAHCSDEYPMWMLAAAVQHASRGRAEPVDLAAPENADERLAWAIEVLGLDKFGGRQPAWLLASWWG